MKATFQTQTLIQFMSLVGRLMKIKARNLLRCNVDVYPIHKYRSSTLLFSHNTSRAINSKYF